MGRSVASPSRPSISEQCVERSEIAPTSQQYYSGHKRKHGLKYHALVAADGMVFSCWCDVVNAVSLMPGRMEPARSSDAGMLNKSGLIDQLETHAYDEQQRRCFVFGDLGYGCVGDVLIAGWRNAITPEKITFNKQMAKVRIVIEWLFGIVTTCVRSSQFTR